MPVHRRAGPCREVRGLLPVVVAVMLILVPATTAEFGYRYVLAAVPLA